MDEFIEKLLSSENNNVCILDNNLVEFLNEAERKNLLSIEDIFDGYDFIIVPKWVYIEIGESQHRIDYINRIQSTYPNKFIIIEEFDYSKLSMYKEADLYHLFCYACDKLGREKGYLKRILGNSDVSEIDERWLDSFYENGIESCVSDNRTSKKNAGEISITVLAYILAIYYKTNIEYITIFTYDTDCYLFIKNCEVCISKYKEIRNAQNISHITFKSNDCILAESIKDGIVSVDLDKEKIMSLKGNERYIIYIQEKEDKSIYNAKELISLTNILDFYSDETIKIIF